MMLIGFAGLGYASYRKAMSAARRVNRRPKRPLAEAPVAGAGKAADRMNRDL